MSQDIYDPAFVKAVFDRCGAKYRYWSHIVSFGFIAIWRRQCIDNMPEFPEGPASGLDLMAGTGETWPYLLKRRRQIEFITAVDISPEMNRQALDRLHRSRAAKIRLIEADFLDNAIPADYASFAVCTFGVKTFNLDQQAAFARELARILKPGGVFSLIEASDPRRWIFGGLFRFYLKRCLPLVEWAVLRGAQDFSMLGVYTRNFGDCRHLAACLTAEGLEVQFKAYFFGCATGVTGRKP